MEIEMSIEKNRKLMEGIKENHAQKIIKEREKLRIQKIMYTRVIKMLKKGGNWCFNMGGE